jgi:hypothetical protein
MSPYRFFERIFAPTPKTSKLKLFLWWRKGGHRRLQAARLRRGGFLGEALIIAGFGARTIIDLIRVVPDPMERVECHQMMVRYYCSPVSGSKHGAFRFRGVGGRHWSQR